ncbi:neuropeptide FF receptor 2-like [Littorina saxatilis]
MKSTTIIFILSKSVSDLLVGIVVSSFALTQTLFSSGQSSGLRCQLPVYIEYTCIAASVFSLVALGVDRYIAVVHPINKKITCKRAVLLVVALWIFSVLFSLQLTYQYKYNHLGENKPCSLLIEDKDEHVLFLSIDFGILFVVPSIVLSYMYTKIAQNLRTRRSGATENVRHKRKVVKYLIISLAAFFLSWCPFYIGDIVGDSLKRSGNEEKHAIVHGRFYLILKFTFAVMALGSSFVSPLIYIIFFSSIRRGAKVTIMRMLGTPAIDPQHNCSALLTMRSTKKRTGCSQTQPASLTRFSAADPTSPPGMSSTGDRTSSDRDSYVSITSVKRKTS